ncbi:clostripain-related cysteine peptidase [uncultured Bacteroides sp.]|uniref:clostripain-related cysteine peptidase n=1 Tax=uncultured Bacteroides sp. TaxID=162156 RepID=UPI0026060BD7|nr:clostripain-related cysteine peptidase [uncultured Bacteroides sp.]
MKKILFLLLSVFVFTACSDEIPEESLPVKSGRTVLAYLISNNRSGNLDRNLKQNLVDMYSGLAQSKDSCTLLVYYRPYNNDGDGLEGPAILKYSSDGNGNINGHSSLNGGDLNARRVIQESDGISCFKEEQNHISTSPETMKRILNLMVNMSPSQSYGVVFGSHGTSWMPGNTVSGRSFGDDAGYNINIPEMADVLENVFGGKQLDFILFDACMMATAEVCYEFKDVTDYLIGAVVETHVYGHPYDIVLPKLYEKEVPYNEVCEEYIKYSKELNAWGTCAAVDCSKMDDLAEWVGANLEVYSDKLYSLDKDDVQQYGVNSFKYFSFDIVDYFKNLNAGNTPEGLEDVMNKVVVAKDALYGVKYPIVGDPSCVIEEDRFCGIGMYIPNKLNNSNWNSYYKTLSWYKAVGWDRF